MTSSDDMLAAGGVLFILLSVIVYNHFQVARSHGKPATGSTGAVGDETMVGRYAMHRGHVMGEVMAVTGDKLVLRQSGVHRVVPLALARMREGELHLVGDVDWAAAEEAGRNWIPEGSSPAFPPGTGGT